MPELPEVETVVRGLRPRAQGKLIQRVEIRQAPTYGVIRGNLRSFRRALSGARISRIGRRAKYILLDLEHPRRAGKSLAWVVHLGMTGQLYVCKPSAPRETCSSQRHTLTWASQPPLFPFMQAPN